MDNGEVQHVKRLHDHSLLVSTAVELVAGLHVDERRHLAVNPAEVIAFALHWVGGWVYGFVLQQQES